MAEFELENTRRDLIAMRVRHGADTPIGHRCSNIVEQLKNIQTASGDQRVGLEAAIKKQLAELAALCGGLQ
jgi:hypothetical protein